MTAELRQRLNAAVVFAFCGGCALLLWLVIDLHPLSRFREVAFGCFLGLLAAAFVAPVLKRLWASRGRAARLKLITCGACVGVTAVTAMGAADALRSDHQWLVESLQSMGVPMPWHAWLGLWFDWLLPMGALLFIVAGACAAPLFGKVACSQAA